MGKNIALKIKRNKTLYEIVRFLYIIIGIVLMGLAFNSFFINNHIAPSGFGGISALISQLFYNQLHLFYISPSILYLFMNCFLLFFAWKILGKKYVFYSILGIGLYSLCIEYVDISINFGGDMILPCIFGSLLMGIGTGLVVRGGGSTGGGEMLGNILHKINNEISIGTIIIIIDSFVCLLSFATYGIVGSLYTLIAIYISGKITDFVIDGEKGTKAYYIISDKYEDIASLILTKLYRGATLIDGTGVYSKNKKNILLCLLNKYEARDLKEIVFEVDENAFLFSTSVIEAYGNGFEKQIKYRFNKQNKEIINKKELNSKIDQKDDKNENEN